VANLRLTALGPRYGDPMPDALYTGSAVVSPEARRRCVVIQRKHGS
jgi:hypothetical protein